MQKKNKRFVFFSKHLKKEYKTVYSFLGCKFSITNKRKKMLYLIRQELLNLQNCLSNKIENLKLEMQGNIKEAKILQAENMAVISRNLSEMKAESEEQLKALNTDMVAISRNLSEMKAESKEQLKALNTDMAVISQNLSEIKAESKEQLKALNTAMAVISRNLSEMKAESKETYNALDSNMSTSISQNNIQYQQIETNLKDQRSIIFKYYQELNFADLLHDSIINNKWLKDKNFSLYGWAANYSFIYTLFRILDNVMPISILEMGMGQTSKLTSQYITHSNPSASLDIIESDKNWIDIYSKHLAISNNVKINQCDLEIFQVDEASCYKYKNLDKIVKNKKYDLIIVDGPRGSLRQSRQNIVDLITTNLAEDFVIIFDDAERNGEKETIEKTKEKLKNLGIDFGVQQRFSLKAQLIMYSKSRSFVQYL